MTAGPQTLVGEVDQDNSTRIKILEAALHCFTHLGVERASVNDVARVAKLSRGTIYRYFENKAVLKDAVFEYGKEMFFSAAEKKLARMTTLSNQVGGFAELVAQTLVTARTQIMVIEGDEAFMRIVMGNADPILYRTMKFFRPLVVEAKARGEIRARADVDETCEWIARALMSMLMVPASPSFDITNPGTVRRYLQRYMVPGLD